MNVAVTGGTGFLGRRVVRDLVARGHRVRCAVRPSSDVRALAATVGPQRWPMVETMDGDIGDLGSNARLLEGCTHVVHMAATLGVSASVMFQDTVIPTSLLVQAAADAGIERFVHISSLAVHHTAELPTNAVVDASTPIEPHPHLRDPYTHGKVAQEHTVWQARDRFGVPVVVIRPGVLFGPGRDLLSGRLGLEIGPLLVRLGSNHPLPYSYVDNCASAIVLAVDTHGIDGCAFDIVDDELPTGSRLVAAMRAAGRPIRTIRVPGPLVGPAASAYERYGTWSKGQVPPVITRYRADSMWRARRYSNAEAHRALAWRPRVGLDEALDLTVAALRTGAT